MISPLRSDWIRGVLLAAAGGLLLASCGGAAPDLDTLCSDVPPPSAYNGDLVTSAACPFEQQTDNILHFGTQVSAMGVPLKTATGTTTALVQRRCGNWLMGKDDTDTTIVVHALTGEVRSHGEFHAGYPVTDLPATLSAPLSY